MTPVTSSDLPRKLTLFDGAALLVGSVIGSGIFVVPSLIAQRVPEPGLVIAIWVFSGLLVLCGALALAELGTMLPQSGGLYVYMPVLLRRVILLTALNTTEQPILTIGECLPTWFGQPPFFSVSHSQTPKHSGVNRD